MYIPYTQLRAMRKRAQNALARVLADPGNTCFRETLSDSLGTLLDAHSLMMVSGASVRLDSDVRPDDVFCSHFIGIKSLYTAIKRMHDYGARSSVSAPRVNIFPEVLMTTMLEQIGHHSQIDVIQSHPGWKRAVTLLTIPKLPNQYFAKSAAHPWVQPRPSQNTVFESMIRDPELRMYTADRCCVCGKTSGLMHCKGCKHAPYCSKDHQREHWVVHKPHCRRIRELV
jgi:hypothetical protein